MKYKKICSTVMVIIIILFTFNTVMSIVPWYSMKSIEIIGKDFRPGDIMRVKITRNVLITVEVHLVRELIKTNPQSDEMVYQINEYYGIRPGLRTSIMFLPIPTLKQCPHLSGNSYIWRGTMVYRPFGLLQKTVTFETEKFHINVNPRAERSAGTPY